MPATLQAGLQACSSCPSYFAASWVGLVTYAATLVIKDDELCLRVPGLIVGFASWVDGHTLVVVVAYGV